MAARDAELEAVLEKIRAQRNFDFHHYKRATLRRRIERRLAERECKSFGDYLALLDADPVEVDTVISEMFINVTAFFRDPDTWSALESRVLPELVERIRARRGELRVWCAGSSTGQEAYSIAMLLAELLGGDLRRCDLKVFGTDVDEQALAVARRATYDARQVAGLSRERLERWFMPAAGGYQVNKELRRRVVFGVNNLVSDAPISRLDLLLCRNVFIYLDAELQHRVLGRFHYALKRDGILLLGKSELLPLAARMFAPIDLPRRIYRKQSADGMLAAAEERVARLSESHGDVESETKERPVINEYHRDVLSSLPLPVIATGLDGTVSVWNRAAAELWNRTEGQVVGKKLAGLALEGLAGAKLDEKTATVLGGRAERERIDGLVRLPGRSEASTFSIEISPLRDQGLVAGLLYLVLDVTALRGLESDLRRASSDLTGSHEQLRVSHQDLQSSNEELETTNEELQSSNEELQTTNEELQSTNEELETTNEELQSANEELDSSNRELAARTEEMRRLALYQRTIIRSLSAAVVVIDADGRITAWNLAAERLLGLAEGEALGQFLWNLRVPALGRALMQRIRRALGERRALRAESVSYELATGGKGFATLAAVPLVEEQTLFGAVVLFEDTTRARALAQENLRLKDGGQRKRVAAARSKSKPRPKPKAKGKAGSKADRKARPKARAGRSR